MNLHLSTKLMKTANILFIYSAMSICLASLVSCSTHKTHDYSIKDSLYFWSDGVPDSSAEANDIEREYHAINSMEDTSPKSNKELVSEDKVNHQIAEIDIKLAEIDSKLARLDLGTDSDSRNDIKQPETRVADKPNDTLIKTDIDISTDIKPEEETLLAVQSVQSVQGVETVETVETVEVVETVESVQSLESAEVVERVETLVSVQDVPDSINSVEDINRITQENPTAAGVPVNQVIPAINAEMPEQDLSSEILLLASQSEYQEDVEEYGMWQLVKGDSSPYQEICTLSSSTIQVDENDYSTQVWFNVVGNALLVNSTTNIDVNRAKVGIKFDNASIQPFSKNYFSTSAVWSGDINSALNQNKVLNVSLGGNELGPKTQSVAIDLKDLKKAYADYRKCNQGTQIGSL